MLIMASTNSQLMVVALALTFSVKFVTSAIIPWDDCFMEGVPCFHPDCPGDAKCKYTTTITVQTNTTSFTSKMYRCTCNEKTTTKSTTKKSTSPFTPSSTPSYPSSSPSYRSSPPPPSFNPPTSPPPSEPQYSGDEVFVLQNWPEETLEKDDSLAVLVEAKVSDTCQNSFKHDGTIIFPDCMDMCTGLGHPGGLCGVAVGQGNTSSLNAVCRCRTSVPEVFVIPPDSNVATSDMEFYVLQNLDPLCQSRIKDPIYGQHWPQCHNRCLINQYVSGTCTSQLNHEIMMAAVKCLCSNWPVPPTSKASLSNSHVLQDVRPREKDTLDK